MTAAASSAAESKAKSADSKLSPALLAAREHTRMVAKWGAINVPGMDQRRAEAIGLQPMIKQIGYSTNTQELPPVLRTPGDAARFVRRTAELLLHSCEVWKQIEINCRETNNYYKELLTTARVHEEAFRTAADILSKIMERPGLLSVCSPEHGWVASAWQTKRSIRGVRSASSRRRRWPSPSCWM